MRRALGLAALTAGFVATATMPASADSWGWRGNHWGSGFGVSVGFGGGPYYGHYAYGGPAACTCPPRVVHRGWGTRAYAYAPDYYDYGYAYAPGYAYYDDYGYAPGVSVGFGFSSDFRHRHRHGHWRGDHWRSDGRIDRNGRDRGLVRTGMRGDADLRGNGMIRGRADGMQVSGDTRGSARISTEGRGGRGEAQFRGGGDAQIRGGGMSGGAAMDGGARVGSGMR